MKLNRIVFDSFRDALVTVIVPVFNEENILSHVDLLISELKEYFTRYEIIVVSDGSTDSTNSKLMLLRQPEVRVQILEQNMGKGAAIRQGFQSAKGDFVFFIDGGMELHPRELRIFLGLMAIYDADIVIGSKRHPQSKIDYPVYRRILSRIYQGLIHRLFEVDVTDTQVGIKLFKREVVQAILPHLEINRYGFDLEILSLASLKGYKNILEAPIRLDYFVHKRRFFLLDLWHVFRVGLSLLSDTFKLYSKLRKLRLTSIDTTPGGPVAKDK